MLQQATVTCYILVICCFLASCEAVLTAMPDQIARSDYNRFIRNNLFISDFKTGDDASLKRNYHLYGPRAVSRMWTSVMSVPKQLPWRRF